ncbi:MAG: discoidin domain-containing protein [Paludibacteraceae bacterium]|nr:discoidin domain-containing protein [Paludibacteraceae bacterium]
MKKKLTILFALLCASVMGFELKAATEASCTIAETGYEYTFSNNVAGDVTLVVTLDAALPGASPEPEVYNASNAPTKGSTSDGKVFTFSLGQFSDGDMLNYRTYFPYESGGLYQQSNLHYTVGTSCSGSEPTGMCGSNIFDSNIGGEDPYKIKLTSVKIDNVYYVRVESTKDGASIQRVFTDNIWCHTSYGNLQLGIAANHRVIDGKLYFIIPSTTVPYIYTGDGVYVHYTDGADRSYPSTQSVPLTECSDEIDYGVDLISPSITAASLVSKTSANAIIAITATDNVAVTACTVYDGTARLGDYAVVDGKITVTELMFNHAYTLTIKAKDAAGNMSANSADVAVTTDDNTEIIDHSPGENLGNMAVLAGTSATSTTGNAGAAIDDNTGSRWESASSDPQVWTLDLGQERVFNNIQVRWEGAYGKTFTLAISNDNINWTTVHYIKGQSLSGFPYEQSIDLPQLKARYIRFHGIERGTGYGYSFWEFRVFFAGEPPMLSTITASVDKRYCQVSTESANISLICKDQYNQDIDPGEVTYNVLPDASYGTVTAGVFTPLKPGLISITAQAGLVVSNTVQIWGTSSANLAYNHLHSASTGESVIDNRPASQAVDNNEGTEWQSHAGTADTDEGRTYDAWLIVDLGDKYDVELVAVKFEGASSQIYRIEFIDDLANEWKEGATYSGGAGINPHRDEHSSLSNNTGVRFVRLFSTKAATQYGMKVQELRVFGTVAASPTKSVSADVNDPAMGTATVKQNDAVVTEVATGSTVTFSATPNDGYVFVNWSNGETRATFDAVVNSTMNLTANFRALGNIYCNTEVTSTRDDDVHKAYATMKRTSANNYKLVVRSAETLGNFSNTTLQVNGSENLNLNNQGTLTDNNHMLTYEFTSTTPPSMTSGYMYLNVPGSKFTECWFTKLTNIEYEVPCEDENVPVESISLNYTETTIEIGNTKTLVVTFNPVYATDKTITWTSTNSSVASVDNGVVTANAIGTATITAATSNGKTATCAVTVEAVTEKTCWGGGNAFTYQGNPVSYYYAITRNVDKTLTYTAEFSRDVAGLGIQVNVHNDAVYSPMSYDSGSKTATFTTTEKFNTGNSLHGFFYFGGYRTDYYYTIGDECAKPSVAVTGVTINHTSATLMIDETVTLSAEVAPANADDKEIVWENSDPSVASFESSTGLVTALAVGTTTITAKSHADGSIFATCVVKVSSALTPTTWYGYGTFTPQEGLTGFTYSITRNSNRSLTYTIVLDKDPVGFVGELNIKDDGVYSAMTYTPATHTATFTTDENYALDGDVLNKSFWWLKYNGGVDRVNFSYTVGSENDPLPQAVAVDETKDNKAILTTYDGHTVIGVLGRSFTSGSLYTLVLPFDVDAAQTASQLPGQLTKLNNSYLKDNGDLRINFVNVSAVEAGVPYLYQPSADVTNPTFEGVEVSATLHPTKPTDGYAQYHGIYAPMEDGNALHAITNAYVLGPDQYLYAVSDLPNNQTMKALRAYFVLNFSETTPGSPKRLAKVVFNENETETTTDIEDLQTDIECTKVIVNGQLQIIRDGKTYNAFGQLVK